MINFDFNKQIGFCHSAACTVVFFLPQYCERCEKICYSAVVIRMILKMMVMCYMQVIRDLCRIRQLADIHVSYT